MRSRLYLDAQEQILSSTSKVIVDQPGGNSLLYLPLDKLMAAGAVGSSTSSNAATTVNTVKQPENLEESSRDLGRDRDRDSR